MKKQKTVRLLCIALCLVLLGSIFAMLINSNFGKTKISRVSFDTETGTLSGLLYLPKDASAENPKPTVIVTHPFISAKGCLSRES